MCIGNQKSSLKRRLNMRNMLDKIFIALLTSNCWVIPPLSGALMFFTVVV